MKRRMLIVAAVVLALFWGFTSVDRVEGHTRITTNVTWGEHIRPILREKCMTCHHPGGIAPDYVDLTTYGTGTEPGSWAWRASIEDMILTGQMPPWKADTRFGSFSNVRQLTEEEIQIILAWTRGGGPQGPLRNLPVPPEFLVTNWQFGEPDLIFALPEEHVLPADRQHDSITVTLPVEIEEDTWVTAVEFLPMNPKNIYSMTAYLHDPEDYVPEAIEVEFQKPYDPFADEDDLEGTRMREMPAGPHFLGQWIRGDSPVLFPDAAGRKLRAGSTVELTIVYRRPDFAEWSEDIHDASKVGLFLAGVDEEIDLLVESKEVAERDFVVKAGASDQEVRTTFTFDENVHLIGLNPRLGLLGKSFEAKVTYPDGMSKTVLWVPEYKYKWGSSFIFEEPIAAPVDSVLELIARYDNSADNWDNPNSPPIDVRAGAGVELAALIDYTLDDHLYITPVFVPRDEPERDGSGMSIFSDEPLVVGESSEDGDPAVTVVAGAGKALIGELLTEMGGDEIYWCPMRGGEMCPIHDYHGPGTCDTCGMALKSRSFFLEGKDIAPEVYDWVFSSVGSGPAYWCPNRGRDDHELLDYRAPGTCSVCGTALAHKAQFETNYTYMCMMPECAKYEGIYFGPGLCPECGQPVVGMGHMDHNAVHGGWLFMAPNLYHHLEGTMPATGEFRMYFYDDWKQPLDPRNFSAKLFFELEDEATGDIIDQEYEIGYLKDGDGYFTAQLPVAIPTDENPVVFYTMVTLAGEEERFDFDFFELTTEPEPTAVRGPILLHNDSDYKAIPIPPTVPGIVQELARQAELLGQLIEGEQWLSFHAPAFDTKNMAKALVDNPEGLNVRQRGALRKAVTLINRGANGVENAGHAMDAPRVAKSLKIYSEGVAKILELYPEAVQ